MPKKKTYEEVKYYIESLEGFILISTEYIGNKNKLQIKCPLGHIYEVNFNNFMSGSICNECSKIKKSENMKHSFKYVKDYIESFGFKLKSEDYKGNKEKLNIECPKGHLFAVSFHNFKDLDSRCKICWFEYIRLDSPLKYDYAYIKLNIERDGNKLLSETYEGSLGKLKIKCPSSHIFYMTWTMFQQGSRCRHCICGENHPNWKKDLTDEDRVKYRGIPKYNEWIKSIYKRDNYTCQCCGVFGNGTNLNVHHLDGYGWCKERRTDLTNGITLCASCHCLDEDSFHLIYGKGNNTEAQFWEWIENKIYKYIEDNFEVSSFLCRK